jgi:hypothetical protein
MARLRYNGLSNSLGASLSDSATSVTFTSKLTHVGGDVPTIAGSDYIPLSILDADGLCAEVVHLTAYTAEATSGTIGRGKDGTAAVAHDSGAVVVNAPTTADFGAYRLLARTTYNPGSLTNSTVSNNTLTDMDATNLAVTFTAPASGAVVAQVSVRSYSSGGGNAAHQLGFRSGSSTVTGSTQELCYWPSGGEFAVRNAYRCVITGLTAGSSYTWKLAHANSTNSGKDVYAQYGGAVGAAAIEIFADE